MKLSVITFIVLLCIISFMGCSDSGQHSAALQQQTLFSKIGGAEKIEAIAGDFVNSVVNDPALQEHFYHMKSNAGSREHFTLMLSEQFIVITGGPARYSGMDMKSAHKGMSISDEEYNAMVQDLVSTLNKHGIAKEEHQQFINLINDLRTDIVGQ